MQPARREGLTDGMPLARSTPVCIKRLREDGDRGGGGFDGHCRAGSACEQPTASDDSQARGYG